MLLLRLILSVVACFTVFGSLSASEPLEMRREQKARLLATAGPLEKLASALRLSAEYAAPSIVHIETTHIRAVPPEHGPSRGRSARMQVEESGTGVVADFQGKWVVLTNRHVVEGINPDAITIRTMDRRYLRAERVRTNADFDLAVIEIEARPDELVAADFGDSDHVLAGDIILAVGSPFGLEYSLSMGIVSAVDRRRIPVSGDQRPLCGFFQIDAAVNPGSSGGPMLNLRGEIVGLITAIATQSGGNEGVAFAIPIKNILPIAQQLAKNEVAVRPFIGLGFDSAFGRRDHEHYGLKRLVGARIDRVLPDSPAIEAELQPDDVILKMGDVEIEDDLHVVGLISRAKIGQPVPLVVLRNGKQIKCSITPTSQISR